MVFEIEHIQVLPYDDQKPGTSGLRKKTRVFMTGTYTENFVESYFQSFAEGHFNDSTLLLAGDGRYFTIDAIHIISEIAAAHGVRRIWTGLNGLCSTPAASSIIRTREEGIAIGGIILTASHNPGGLDNDFGIKFNISNGGPASESITNKIYEISKKITSYKRIKLPKFSLDRIGVFDIIPNRFTIEVIDTVDDWLRLQKEIFDFNKIRKFIQRTDFKMVYDTMHGVSGPYAMRLFVNEFGLSPNIILHNEPLPDFGGLHPDPNLTYASELVNIMKIKNPNEANSETPDFGAAGDGDCDRNMILGKGFFVTPSDSVAIIAAYAASSIPYFFKGLPGVSRSMPTSSALNFVAERLGIPCYEVPTGWKYFGNLMDAGLIALCGEESFGTGSSHIREKDGLWAILAWLSILAYNNSDENKPLITIKQIVENFWKTYGRNYYTRFDYEQVEADRANEFYSHLKQIVNNPTSLNTILSRYGFSLLNADNFTYIDPVDGSISKNQGLRFVFTDGSRIVVRLSGTGSSGATIRVYMEKSVNDPTKLNLKTNDVLKELIEIVEKELSLEEITGRKEPSVIT